MSELTADAVSKILLEKFPPKTVEVEGGETTIDVTDERTVQNSIIVSLARRVEVVEKGYRLLNKQNKEILLALRTVADRVAALEGRGTADAAATEAATPPPPPQAAAPAAEEATEEEGVPEPNVRSAQPASVMPNAAPAPNGSRS